MDPLDPQGALDLTQRRHAAQAFSSVYLLRALPVHAPALLDRFEKTVRQARQYSARARSTQIREALNQLKTITSGPPPGHSPLGRTP